mmetsp:Transcript_9560/g.28454  ORF Transcript_9560/g.28454 Transcript_9560/m.28454 type:complete len:229 (+) Transcript_9560:466-1152(+)
MWIRAGWCAFGIDHAAYDAELAAANPRFMSAEAAVALIRDDAVVAFSGVAANVAPSLLVGALRRRHLATAQEQKSPTCAPDRPSKILLVQVGTLSSSHPSFGVSVFFLSFFLVVCLSGRRPARPRARRLSPGRCRRDAVGGRPSPRAALTRRAPRRASSPCAGACTPPRTPRAAQTRRGGGSPRRRGRSRRPGWSRPAPPRESWRTCPTRACPRGRQRRTARPSRRAP